MAADYTITHCENYDADIETLTVQGEHNAPTIVYHHGYLGTMHGQHSINIAQVAENHNCNYLAFNNLGHGETPTYPLDDSDMAGWVTVAQDLISEYSLRGNPLILVGNSLGAGILSNAVHQMGRTKDVKGFIGIGALPDVIQREIADARNMYEQHGIINEAQQSLYNLGLKITAPYPTSDSPVRIPIWKDFFEAATKHSVFDQNIQFDCKAYLFHGEHDPFATEARTREFAECFNNFASGITCMITNEGHDLAGDSAKHQIAYATSELLLNLGYAARQPQT